MRIKEQAILDLGSLLAKNGRAAGKKNLVFISLYIKFGSASFNAELQSNHFDL